ncbi:MAG: DivIVA domain-containing protein [Clostridia bacterium]|nr:DivIVA domain-containing protein [Clostridia bacterium]
MLTPLEIQKIEFRKSIGGYKRADIDEMMPVIQGDYEALYKENIKLKDRLEVLEDLVNKYKSMEDTMRETLVVAQKAADDLAKGAEQKAQVILERAENEATLIREAARADAAQTLRMKEQTERDILSYGLQIDSILNVQKELTAKLINLRSDKDGLQSDVEPAEDTVPDEGVASAERT